MRWVNSIASDAPKSREPILARQLLEQRLDAIREELGEWRNGLLDREPALFEKTPDPERLAEPHGHGPRGGVQTLAEDILLEFEEGLGDTVQGGALLQVLPGVAVELDCNEERVEIVVELSLTLGRRSFDGLIGKLTSNRGPKPLDAFGDRAVTLPALVRALDPTHEGVLQGDDTVDQLP